ncbi:hypothetical protein I4U23_011275 [Adineta vaga]|nr:hypothetical protein I4U23_011275 [Adineta vaga]
MSRSEEPYLKDQLLSPPLYHQTTNYQQPIPNQYPTAPNIAIKTPSSTNENQRETSSGRHPCEAIIITAIVVGGIIILAVIIAFTYIFIKRTSPIPPVTITITTTKRPICFDGSGLLVKEDGSRIKIRDVKIGDEILVAHHRRNKQIEIRSSPILAMDIFQKYNNDSPIDYLEILFESNVNIKPLQITPKHSLLIKKKNQSQPIYIFAEQVQIGDYLYLMRNYVYLPIEAKIVQKNHIKLFDAYAPLTLEGTLIVNDVIVSCYGTLKHSFVHLLMTPRRWLLYSIYQVISFIKGPIYMKEHEDFLEDYFHIIDFFRLSIRNRILDLMYQFK